MEYLILAAVFFTGGILPELAGFGVATVAMATLPFVLPINTVIPLVAMLTIVATGIVSFETKSWKMVQYITPLLTGSLIGVTAGMFFLKAIDAKIPVEVLGIFLITYALHGLSGRKALLTMKNSVGILFGIAAGFIGALFNINGPLVGMYSAANNAFTKIEIKNMVSSYIYFTGSFAVAGHMLSGRITGPVLTYFLVSLPFLLFGVFVGKKLSNKINADAVRNVIYFLVLTAGSMFLFK